MKLSTTTVQLTRLLLVVVLSASPLAAQQKHGTTPRKPAPASPAQPAEPSPTFDTLLADDSYKIYVEVRGVGQLIRSPAFNDLLEPVTKIAGPSKEFNTLLKWLDRNADSLAGSRLFVASWPTQTNLPAVLLAIEFASPEEAQKFEPQLRRFIPTLVPTPEPTPPQTAGQPLKNQATPQVQPEPASAPLPYYITHTGSLVVLSDKAFAFRDLKSRNAKLLAEDQNFVTARNRFTSESLFLYVDVKAIEKEEQDRRKKYEEENQRVVEQELNRAKEEQAASSPEVAEPTIVEATELPTPEDSPPPADNGTATLSSSAQVQAPTATLSGQESSRDSALMNTLTYSLYGSLFGGQPKWPEAIAAALSFEGNDYVLRALIINSTENKAIAVPFLPQLISGPALIPASPAVIPADSDLFVAASLEYPQMYDGLLKSIAGLNERGRDYSMQPVNDTSAASPFAEFEKKLGLKIKDDIFPLLGNELAVAMVPKAVEANSPDPSAAPAPPQTAKTYDPDPLVAIAVKDREAVRNLIPKFIQAMGFKGAGLIAQTEKKDDTETTTYANLFTYAFIGDFLILSTNPAAVKGAVASYLSGETLASSNYFRNANRWQSRQVQAQVYMAPIMVERYGLGSGTTSVNEKTTELLSRVNLPIEPLTYSLLNEGSGPLHELHFPKNLLLLMVARISNDANTSLLKANEAAVRSQLRSIVSAEATYQATTGDGRYGTIDDLVKAGLLSKEPFERFGYVIELTVSSNKFEATAVPIEYGKSGSLSFFADESGIVRGADRAGGPATISDPPI